MLCMIMIVSYNGWQASVILFILYGFWFHEGTFSWSTTVLVCMGLIAAILNPFYYKAIVLILVMNLWCGGLPYVPM